MSFDQFVHRDVNKKPVSIPLEQGNVFRLPFYDGYKGVGHVSIPLEQGNVFRQNILAKREDTSSLNPFRTGQCLSTQLTLTGLCLQRLNPFRTGQCLSTK